MLKTTKTIVVNIIYSTYFLIKKLKILVTITVEKMTHLTCIIAFDLSNVKCPFRKVWLESNKPFVLEDVTKDKINWQSFH